MITMEPSPRIETAFAVLNQDCLVAAVELCADTSTVPAVLNMANEYNCGGGFDSVRGSQEEYLFRNSSLAASLWPHRRVQDNRWSTGSELLGCSQDSFYPITACGGIYSPCVDVFGVDDQPLRRPRRIAVLSIAAQDLRPGRTYNAGAAFDFGLTVDKLRTLLHMALANGHRRLVLGAPGCGAFLNPPEEVARAFAALLTGAGEFAGRFQTVAFAIAKSPRNLRAFEARFGPSLPRAAHLLLAPPAGEPRAPGWPAPRAPDAVAQSAARGGDGGRLGGGGGCGADG